MIYTKQQIAERAHIEAMRIVFSKFWIEVGNSCALFINRQKVLDLYNGATIKGNIILHYNTTNVQTIDTEDFAFVCIYTQSDVTLDTDWAVQTSAYIKRHLLETIKGIIEQ